MAENVAPDEREETARRLVAERMALYGYTPEQIEAASQRVNHYEAGCSLADPGMWDCTDENGRSFHPEHDEYDQTAEFVVWVLDALSFRPGDQDTAGCAYFPSCGRNCDPPCSIRAANTNETGVTE